MAHLAPKTQAAPPAHQPAAPGARLALGLLLAINLINYVDRYVLAAVLPKLKAEFFPAGGEFVSTSLGSLTTAFMVAYMLLAPVFGWLADRWSRWTLIGLAVVFWSLATGGSGLAATFTLLFLTRCLVGVGEAAYGPAAPTLISDLYPASHRGWVLAWFNAAIPVGSALGYGLGGYIAGTFGWRWAFYAVVPPGLVLGVVCLLLRDPPRGQADNADAVTRLSWRQYGRLLETPSYVLGCLGMTAATFVIGGIAVWMPDFIISNYPPPADGHDLVAEVNLYFGAILAGAGLLATLIGGWLGDFLRDRVSGAYFLVSGGGMILGFPCFLACLYFPFPGAWVWIGLTVFCLFLNTGPANTILVNVTHPALRGGALALNILVIHALGDAVSPTVIGFVSDVCGKNNVPNMTAGFLFASGMVLVSGFLWVWGAWFLDRDTKLAPTRLST